MKIKAIGLLTILAFIMFFATAEASQRMVLCEKFTNTSCSPCYNANIVMDELVRQYPDYMAVIRYHVWWPSEFDPFYVYNPSENGIRTNYYGINAVPHLQVDGIIDAGGHSQYWSVISNRYNVASPIEITYEGSFDRDLREGTLDITATATDNISLDGLFLRAALTESEIFFPAPNGIVYHHQTMRHMFPYSLGTRIYLSEPEDFDEVSLDISCPDSIVIEYSEIVIFVQSEENREVLQAIKIPLESLTSIDEPVLLPDNFQLNQNYPNPFNAGTVIDYQLAINSHVELTVYDILGQKIKTLADKNQAAGHHTLYWDGTDYDNKAVTSGVYFYKLSSEGASETKRMTLIK